LLVCLFFLVLIGQMIYSSQFVIHGHHEHRQADSMAPGYYFCKDYPNSSFFKPKIGPRGISDGVAINEFPLYSTLLGYLCILKKGWIDWIPKWVSLFFSSLSALFFYLAFTKKFLLYENNKKDFFIFLFFYLYLPNNLVFFSIPMPESTSLFFISLACFAWTHRENNYFFITTGIFLFSIGFLARPFYIIFLPIFAPNRWISFLNLIICIFLFWLWYRWWNSMVTTVPGYFGIQSQSFGDIISHIPELRYVVFDRLIAHTAIVGIFSFYLVFNSSRKKIIFYYLGCIVLMVSLKSTHLKDHAYYLLNASVLSSFIIYAGFKLISKEIYKDLFVLLFGLVTIITTQHQFHSNGNLDRTMAALKEYGSLPEDAIVATYLGQSPHWLFYIKKTGFIFNKADFNEMCPKGATHMLYELEDKRLKFSNCRVFKD